MKNICKPRALHHGSEFPPQKYQLIHFTRKRIANLESPPSLLEQTINSQKSVIYLGILLDLKVGHTTPIRVTYSYSFSSKHREIIAFYFCLVHVIEHHICNKSMVLRVSTTSGPNMKRHFYSYMNLSK